MESKNPKEMKEQNKTELIDLKNRKNMAAWGVRWGLGKTGKGGQEVQISNYKIVSHGERMYNMETILNNIVVYTWESCQESKS